MHWSDVIGERLVSSTTPVHVVNTGITPSGEFHIGHLREILTGEMIVRGIRAQGGDARFCFVVDSADPLRKVYDFLDEAYEQYVGVQLFRIPPPDADGRPDMAAFSSGRTYADHFLEPFLEALKILGVQPELVYNHTEYLTGRYVEHIRTAIRERDKVREIIERISGRDLPEDWWPFTPVDERGCQTGLQVSHVEGDLIHWVADDGRTGACDITKGEGKLPWRLDWPAKWCNLGVTCEPFGKDHGAAGGSYDTGKELCELLGGTPPEGLTYEWISLRGEGAMSSSSGNTVGPIEALRLVPPEILRYLIASTKPSKAIEFDTGMGLVTLADAYERLLRHDLEAKLEDPEISRRQRVSIEDDIVSTRLSSVADTGERPSAVGVTFRHLAMLVQIRDDDEAVWAMMPDDVGARSEFDARVRRMRHWVNSDHFPEEMRIAVRDAPDSERLSNLAEEEKPLHRALVKQLSDAIESGSWDEATLSRCIPDAARDVEQPLRSAYRLTYELILGVDVAPKLAPLLAAMDPSKALWLITGERQQAS